MIIGYVNYVPSRPVAAQRAQLESELPRGTRIYTEGLNGESLESAIAAFRGRPGELAIAADLRVFGESRKAILATIHRLGEIKVIDIHNKEDENSLPKMIDRAIASLGAYARFKGSKKTAKVTGRRGGKRKAESARENRESVMQADIIKRLCAHPKLTWQDRLDILGEPFTQSTLRRHYI